MKSRAQAMMQAGAKVRAVTTLVFFALGIVVLLTFDYSPVGWVSWLVLSVGVVVAAMYFYYARGWGKPQSFVCPGCRQQIPFGSERCPLCGYQPQ